MQAKQSPAGKAQRAIATDGKTYFSYAQIHATVSAKVDEVRAFKPDVIVAIGGGGFIPARMLRTEVRVPIVAISLELYDDNTRSANTTVIKKQWFDENSGAGRLVRGHRVLIVDEVDDTRATLQYAVEELIRSNGPAAVATFVVHDKLKPKKGVMPPNVQIIVGEEVPDNWNCCARSAVGARHRVTGIGVCVGSAQTCDVELTRRPAPAPCPLRLCASLQIRGTRRRMGATSTRTRSSRDGAAARQTPSHAERAAVGLLPPLQSVRSLERRWQWPSRGAGLRRDILRDVSYHRMIWLVGCPIELRARPLRPLSTRYSDQ